MSLWSAYHKETEGHETLETESGFIRFSLNPPNCYVHDLYVRPDLRRGKYATNLADSVTLIAREAGCTHMWSEVGVVSRTSTEALYANLSYGFKVQRAENGFILMCKEVK